MFAWKWLYRLIYISLYSFLNLVSLNLKNTAQIVYIAQMNELLVLVAMLLLKSENNPKAFKWTLVNMLLILNSLQQISFILLYGVNLLNCPSTYGHTVGNGNVTNLYAPNTHTQHKFKSLSFSSKYDYIDLVISWFRVITK